MIRIKKFWVSGRYKISMIWFNFCWPNHIIISWWIRIRKNEIVITTAYTYIVPVFSVFSKILYISPAFLVFCYYKNEVKKWFFRDFFFILFFEGFSCELQNPQFTAPLLSPRLLAMAHLGINTNKMNASISFPWKTHGKLLRIKCKRSTKIVLYCAPLMYNPLPPPFLCIVYTPLPFICYVYTPLPILYAWFLLSSSISVRKI